MNKYERKRNIKRLIIELGEKVDTLSSKILKNRDKEGNYNIEIKDYVKLLKFDIINTFCNEIIDFYMFFNKEVNDNDIKIAEHFRNMLSFRLQGIMFGLNQNDVNFYDVDLVIEYFDEICNFYEYYKSGIKYND